MKRNYDLELNSIQGVTNSSDKLLMKQAFNRAEVSTCQWFTYNEGFVTPEGEKVQIENYPIVAKHRMGSKGKGNYILRTKEEVDAFLVKRVKSLSMFIFETYTTFCREYRLHVTELGCFYSCRKVRRKDTPEKDRWKFNNETCSWIREDGENPALFNKPATWDLIVEDCQKALKELDLDIACFDVRMSKKGQWKIIESNSAPSLGDVGIQKYLEHLKTLIDTKCADY